MDEYFHFYVYFPGFASDLSRVKSYSASNVLASVSNSVSSVSLSHSLVRQPDSSVVGKFNSAVSAGSVSHVNSSSSSIATHSLASALSSISISESFISQPPSSVAKLNTNMQLKDDSLPRLGQVKIPALADKPLVITPSAPSCQSKALMHKMEQPLASEAGSSSTKIPFNEYMRDLKKIVRRNSQSSTLFDPSAFVIVKCDCYDSEFSDVTVLHSSSELSGMKVEYDYQNSQPSESFKCTIRLGGRQVAKSSCCPTEFKAKCSAASKALGYLSRVCCTVIIKDLGTCMKIKNVITPDKVSTQYQISGGRLVIIEHL